MVQWAKAGCKKGESEVILFIRNISRRDTNQLSKLRPDFEFGLPQ